MDSKTLGRAISTLRKKHKLTQLELATKLNLSDKTISKWESGVGYPDIVHLPAIAEIFGVTVDYLLCEKKRGITVAGSFIVDNLKRIDGYPEIGHLCNIVSMGKAVGGCAPNTSINLATMDKTLPVSVLGCVGDDENGRFLVSTLNVRGVDVSGVKISKKVQTSYCDVMSNGVERTFFSCRGANAVFSPEDIDINALCCTILHVGYIMLLDKFDETDEVYGTKMARFLKKVRETGIKVSIDTVSGENKAIYAEKILPALKFTDYLIVNEIECCSIFNKDPYDKNGDLRYAVIYECMQKAMAMGVAEKVIVHAKEVGFCLSKDGTFTKVGSLIIPKELIKGNVGAGDAFCAGCLYGIYNGFSDKEVLEYASMVAACNLFSENSVDGMMSKKEIEKLAERFKRRSIDDGVIC